MLVRRQISAIESDEVAALSRLAAQDSPVDEAQFLENFNRAFDLDALLRDMETRGFCVLERLYSEQECAEMEQLLLDAIGGMEEGVLLDPESARAFPPSMRRTLNFRFRPWDQ